MSETDIDAILRGGRSGRRWLLISVALVVIAAAAVAAFLLTRAETEDVVLEPERTEAVLGTLTTEVELSGSALPERSASLSFDSGGMVASVQVSVGAEVRTGDVLGALNDTDARFRVETAELQLRLAQLRLEDLLAGPDSSDLASANQAISSANSQVISAERALALLSDPPSEADLASAEQAVAAALGQVSSTEQALTMLSDPPSTADLASAEQAVANALAQVSGAEQSLALLSEPPSAADLASAEQAVANALGQISSAEDALERLGDPPSVADLASAEQAVASALGQLSSAEEALVILIEGASEAELAEARSTVTRTQVELADASRLEEELNTVLTEEWEAFCDRYSGLIPSDDVIRSVCSSALPLSENLTNSIRDSFEDRSAAYETLGTALIDANVAYVAAASERDSALSGLTTAEEILTLLLQPPSSEDVYQAEQAVLAASSSHAAATGRLEDLQSLPGESELYQAQQAVAAAKASHAASVARLDELRQGPSDDDLYQAEQAVEAAEASHTAALARLEDLSTVPSEEDVYQAEQAVEAAVASHSAAVARLNELQAAAEEGDVEQAMATLETALASLASAQAQYDELLAGPTDNAIEQQRQEVRLAEISAEEAQTALAALLVTAPFDGVVEEVNVHPGDVIPAGFAAFTLSTSTRMLVELTVTEEELLTLQVGQSGVASFDAIDGVQYPVQVESISQVPNAEQGVVTYEVMARILTGAGPGGPATQGQGTSRPAFGGFGGGGAGGGGGPGAGAFLSQLELPEGVTVQQIRQALISGEPLPEGVTLPEEVEQMLESFRAGGGSARAASAEQGQAGAGSQESDAASPAALGDRPLPASGMSASVTILTEVREEAVLVPVSAVRQVDGGWFVSVPADSAAGSERASVEVGASDGTNVEILSGIDAGAVVLIGADNAGVAFSATQALPQANPGFGPGPGGFGPGGGGGGR